MIKLENIKKTYKVGSIFVEALKNINLVIENGEMIIVSGVSGSGKSTLLNLIGAMDTPSGGNIIMDDENITLYSIKELTEFRAKKVGFIFQNFNLIPALNVFENIVVPLKLKGQKYNKNEIFELIEKVGLMSHIKHKPDELSGGQKQRVAIARALAHKPQYIMADEPTANLDSNTAHTIISLLKELNRTFNVTVIFASHDEWVLKSIDRKIKLVDGIIEYTLN